MTPSPIRGCAYILLFSLLCAPSVAASNAQPTTHPNVLFIAVDDLNDWIGPLGGHPQCTTPNLDRLAQRGVTFTNAHCQAPICNPSRVSLLTGTYPATTGVYYLSPQVRECEATRDAVTLPQHFQAHGYQSIGVGKIFHSDCRDEFQEYAGNFGAFGPRPDTPISAGHTHPLWDWGAYPERDEEMPDSKIAAWTAQKLHEIQPNSAFFLACGFYRPHVPMFAPPRWFDLHPRDQILLPPQIAHDLSDVPPYGQDLSWSAVAPRHQWIVENNQWDHAVQAYLACVSFVDAQIGKLLDALDQSPHANNTWIVLWGDHGFHLGTKERWGKRSLWEVSTRVPLLIAGPGIRGNAQCHRPVGLIDLYPTLIELCGLPERTGLEGHSLVPLLHEPDAAWEFPALTTFGQNNHAVRSQDFRYIVYADGSEELYDHRNDPNEWTNLAGRPEFEQTIQIHRRWLPQINHPMAPGSAHADARPGSAPDID